jgi:serine/threonine protein kinase
MWELNRESVENEILIYEHLGPHSGILEVQSSGSAIEMPFMVNGNLQNYIQKHQVSWGQKLSWIQGAACTIHDIHKRGVIHGDISTMNFLVTNDRSILLSDFGESVRLETSSDSLNGFSMKTDLFQFGTFVFEIITGQKYIFDVREDEV